MGTQNTVHTTLCQLHPKQTMTQGAMFNNIIGRINKTRTKNEFDQMRIINSSISTASFKKNVIIL